MRSLNLILSTLFGVVGIGHAHHMVTNIYIDGGILLTIDCIIESEWEGVADTPRSEPGSRHLHEDSSKH